MKERFGRFDLELHPDKTRTVGFGRFVLTNRRQRGRGRPKTFDFPGFTHCCAETRKGRFMSGRTPVAKRMARTLKRIRAALRRRRHDNVNETARWLGSVVNGWLNHFAVPTGARHLARFVMRLKRTWLAILRRRSQKDRFEWARVAKLTTAYWPKAKIRHPWPSQRLAVNA